MPFNGLCKLYKPFGLNTDSSLLRVNAIALYYIRLNEILSIVYRFSPRSLKVEHFIFLIWLLWLLQGVFGAYNLWAYIKKMRLQEDFLRKTPEKPPQPAVVIIPIKGWSHSSDSFVKIILCQNYPDYRILFSVESVEDPACKALCQYLGIPYLEADQNKEPSYFEKKIANTNAKSIGLVIAGKTLKEGQKVHNQIQACHHLKPSDAIIVFADADIVCSKEWLSLLIRPLNHGSHDASTTYRWFIPEQNTLANAMTSVINASIATLGGPECWNILWGGSMAITRKTFDAVSLIQAWEGVLSDDLQLTRELKKRGCSIAFVRSLLVPSLINYDWRGLFEFGCRQYFIVRAYTPGFYTLALGGSTLYLAGLLSSWIYLLNGFWTALIPLLGMLLLNVIRSCFRTRLMKMLFSKQHLDRLKLMSALDRTSTSFWMFIHWMIIIASLFMQKVTWAGTTYRVSKGKDRKCLVDIVTMSS